MEKSVYSTCGSFTAYDAFLECGTCGNHVCKTYADTCRGICPHCFGKLYKI